jgi:hypothetical protein
MENLFNELASKNYGDFTYETGNKYFKEIEVSVCFWTSEIEVRYYVGTLLSPVKREKYHSLHGMFGASTLENKFNEIIENLPTHNPFWK